MSFKRLFLKCYNKQNRFEITLKKQKKKLHEKNENFKRHQNNKNSNAIKNKKIEM